MKLSALFAAGIALFSYTTAAPAGPSSDLITPVPSPKGHPAILTARTGVCPSLSTIETYAKTRVSTNTVFYTGSASAQQASNFAATLEPKGVTYSDAFPHEQFLAWIDECGVGPEQDKLVPRMSEALALATRGTAYVLLPAGQAIDPKKIWSTAEYPALQKNGVEVWAVNSKDVSQKKKYDGNSNFGEA
jgi:hypothetical protein